MTSATLLNLAVSIVLLTSIYSLVNVGFVLLYRSTGVPNFAQGHIAMFGGFVVATVVGAGIGYVAGAATAIIATLAVGYVVYRLVMRSLLGAEEFTKAIVTFMLAVVVTQMCLMVWGTEPYDIEQPTRQALSLFGGRLPVMTIITLVVAVALVMSIAWFLEHTLTGTRLQALAENETLSVYAGISVHRLAAVAWAVSFATAGIAGVLYSQRAAIDLNTSEIGLVAFPAAVIGGLNSIKGTFVGALILAFVQTISNYVLGGSYGIIAVYILMLGVLALKPEGLMGSVATRRL